MRKILIIEDELIVRSIYRRKFEMSGYKVETAEEGAAALKLMPEFRPDVIQVDIMMPGMGGVEVIRQIRSWPEFSKIPILVLSSFYRPDLAKEAWKAGASKCVSKMDCTPNLALELVEQLLGGENSDNIGGVGRIPLPTEESAGSDTSIRLRVKLDLPPSKTSIPIIKPPPNEQPPPWPEDQATPEPKLKVDLNLPPSRATGGTPTRPIFAAQKEGTAPASGLPRSGPTFFGKPVPPSFTPAPESEPPPPPAPMVQPTPSAEPSVSGPDFRMEIRQDFLKRVPQIHAELRERTGALIRSKSTQDQIRLLQDLEGTVSSLASMSGITGFTRVSHLSGALDALIKDLRKKPAQMTASVLRTIAHAMDCMNVLFRDLSQIPQEIPSSRLILVVDDEPISRRTVSIALSKADLRCIAIEDSKIALTILKENPFDLVFLDAEMPGVNGFELCAELRKMATNKNTPVIFVTSLTKFEVRAQSSLSGGNDLIAKPFVMMELAVKALTYLLKPPSTIETRAPVFTPRPS